MSQPSSVLESLATVDFEHCEVLSSYDGGPDMLRFNRGDLGTEKKMLGISLIVLTLAQMRLYVDVSSNRAKFKTQPIFPGREAAASGL